MNKEDAKRVIVEHSVFWEKEKIEPSLLIEAIDIMITSIIEGAIL